MSSLQANDPSYGPHNLRARKALCQTLQGAFRLSRDEVFDPSIAEHRSRYARFLATSRWPDGKAFKIEPPYLSITSSVEAKLVRWALRKELEQLE